MIRKLLCKCMCTNWLVQYTHKGGTTSVHPEVHGEVLVVTTCRKVQLTRFVILTQLGMGKQDI